MCGSDIFLGLIAILFPPLAVWVKRGICSADSLINIALCCLGFLPGLFHAWYIIAVTPDPTYESLSQDPERGNVTYYYVQTGQPRYAPPPQPGYGTVGNAANARRISQQQQGVVQPAQQPLASSAAHTQPAPRASEEVPPSYQQATAGDHKIQHD